MHAYGDVTLPYVIHIAILCCYKPAQLATVCTDLEHGN